MLLSDSEKAEAVSEVRNLILASGQQAVLLRRESVERLYGSDDESFAEVCSFLLEINKTPPVELGRKVDATANVLPELDIHSEDRIRYAGIDYRVQSMNEQQLFGVITHKVMELVRLYEG